MPKEKIYNSWLPAVWLPDDQGESIRQLAETNGLRLADVQRRAYKLLIENPRLLTEDLETEVQS